MNTLIVVTLLCALSAIYAVDGQVVMCYYGTWATYRAGVGQYSVSNFEPNLCTHAVYAFNGIYANGTMRSLDPYLDLPGAGNRDNYRLFNGLKTQNPNLKTLLAVGGYNQGSANYSLMAATAETRQNFIRSSLDFVQTYGFDGLDLDWEYPARRDSVNGAADVQNLNQLLRELREEFDRYDLLLTAAVSAVESAASQSYDVATISEYLDFVNVMTYDLHGPWDTETGHNAALARGEGYENEARESLFTVDVAIEYWLNSGCPPEKLLLGVPFYGHSFTLADPAVNGVRAPVTGAGIAGPYTQEAGTLAYGEFCVLLRDQTWNVRDDVAAQVPYASRGNDWVSYDTPESIAAKAAYARSLNLGGVMAWSVESDDFNNVCGGGASPLLRAINTGLGREIPQ